MIQLPISSQIFKPSRPINYFEPFNAYSSIEAIMDKDKNKEASNLNLESEENTISNKDYQAEVGYASNRSSKLGYLQYGEVIQPKVGIVKGKVEPKEKSKVTMEMPSFNIQLKKLERNKNVPKSQKIDKFSLLSASYSSYSRNHKMISRPGITAPYISYKKFSKNRDHCFNNIPKKSKNAKKGIRRDKKDRNGLMANKSSFLNKGIKSLKMVREIPGIVPNTQRNRSLDLTANKNLIFDPNESKKLQRNNDMVNQYGNQTRKIDMVKKIQQVAQRDKVLMYQIRQYLQNRPKKLLNVQKMSCLGQFSGRK